MNAAPAEPRKDAGPARPRRGPTLAFIIAGLAMGGAMLFAWSASFDTDTIRDIALIVAHIGAIVWMIMVAVLIFAAAKDGGET